MAQKEIRVEKRDEFGSGASRRMRAAGRVPGVVYSGGTNALSISVDEHEFTIVGKGSRRTQLFRLVSDMPELKDTVAFVREVQTEPLKDRLLHVDFLAVAAGRAVHITVPIDILGEPAVIKQGEGILQRSADGIEVECIPSNIPESIEVDVSGLDIGDAIHAGDLELPEGVELLSPKDQTIVGITAARLVLEVPEAEAAAAEEALGAAESPEAEPEEESTD